MTSLTNLRVCALQIERRRDDKVPRCFYLPEWQDDPHELAKLDAIYRRRESAALDQILQVGISLD